MAQSGRPIWRRPPASGLCLLAAPSTTDEVRGH
jgi:hypothetical protein